MGCENFSTYDFSPLKKASVPMNRTTAPMRSDNQALTGISVFIKVVEVRLYIAYSKAVVQKSNPGNTNPIILSGTVFQLLYPLMNLLYSPSKYVQIPKQMNNKPVIKNVR